MHLKRKLNSSLWHTFLTAKSLPQEKKTILKKVLNVNKISFITLAVKPWFESNLKHLRYFYTRQSYHWLGEQKSYTLVCSKYVNVQTQNTIKAWTKCNKGNVFHVAYKLCPDNSPHWKKKVLPCGSYLDLLVKLWFSNAMSSIWKQTIWNFLRINNIK